MGWIKTKNHLTLLSLEVATCNRTYPNTHIFILFTTSLVPLPGQKGSYTKEVSMPGPTTVKSYDMVTP